MKPEDRLPNATDFMMWKCWNPEHVPYRARISQRAMGSSCQECIDDKRWASNNEAENKRNRERRRVAKQARFEQPPAPEPAPSIAPVDRPIHSVGQVAAAISVKDQAVVRWIRKGFIYAHRAGAGKGMYLIPESEVVRLRAERVPGPSGVLPFGWTPSRVVERAKLPVAPSTGNEEPEESP